MQPAHPMTRSEWGLVGLLALIQWVHIMDFMIMMPMGPLLMAQFGVSPSQMAFAVSLYAMTAGLVGLLGSHFMDRWPRRTTIIALSTLLGFTTIACGITDHFGVFLCLRGLAGMAGGALGGAIFAAIGDGIRPAHQGKATGTVMAGFSVAAIAGIPLGMLMAHAWGCSTVFAGIGGMGLLAAGLTSVIMPPLSVQSDATPWWQNVRMSWQTRHERHALLMIMAIAMAGFLIIPMINPYLIHNVKLSSTMIPWVYALGGVATLASNQWIGRAVDRWGHQRVLRIILPLSVIPLGGITIIPPLPMMAVLGCTTLFFVLVSGRFVPAMAVMMQAVPAHRRGRFVSLASALQQLGAGGASFLSGKLVHTGAHSTQLMGYSHAGMLSVAFTVVAIGLAQYGPLNDIFDVGRSPPPPPKNS